MIGVEDRLQSYIRPYWRTSSPGLHGIRVPGAYRCSGLMEPTELSAFPGTGPTYDAMIVEGLARKPGWELGLRVKG